MASQADSSSANRENLRIDTTEIPITKHLELFITAYNDQKADLAEAQSLLANGYSPDDLAYLNDLIGEMAGNVESMSKTIVKIREQIIKNEKLSMRIEEEQAMVDEAESEIASGRLSAEEVRLVISGKIEPRKQLVGELKKELEEKQLFKEG